MSSRLPANWTTLALPPSPLGGRGRVVSQAVAPPSSSVVEEEVSYVEKAQVEAFFRAIPQDRVRDRLLFDLAYRHGLRRREIALLTLSGVRPDRIWIGRLKGSVSGEYPLHPSTRKLLSIYL